MRITLNRKRPVTCYDWYVKTVVIEINQHAWKLLFPVKDDASKVQGTSDMFYIKCYRLNNCSKSYYCLTYITLINERLQNVHPEKAKVP